MTDFEPPLRLILDGEALAANWKALNARSGAAQAGAAVKADGYGLGAREVAARLRDAGCRDFFVAHWGEAAAIGDIIPPAWISVLNGIQAADIPHIRALGAVPVLNTPEQLSMWQASGGGRAWRHSLRRRRPELRDLVDWHGPGPDPRHPELRRPCRTHHGRGLGDRRCAPEQHDGQARAVTTSINDKRCP